MNDSYSTAGWTVSLPSDVLADDRRQWVQICPAGKIDTRDGRGPYLLEDAQSVIEASRVQSGAAKMLVDYDHQSLTALEQGGTAIAAGWIIGMQARKSGIWALVEWTEKAGTQIAAKEYRYLSPVLICRGNGTIVRIESVALTNSPNLHEMMALSNKEPNGMKPKSGPIWPSSAEFIEMRKLLDLPDDTDIADVIKAIRALVSTKHANTPDPAEYVPIGEFERAMREANSLRQGIHETSAKTYVEEQIRAGRLAPAFREWGVDLCTKNKPVFDTFLTKTGPAFAPLFNQILPAAYHEPQARAGSISAVEQDICEKMGLTTEQFNAARKRASE